MGKVYPSQEGRKSLGADHTHYVSKMKVRDEGEFTEPEQCRYRNPLTEVRCQKIARAGTVYCPNHHAE